MNDQVIITLTLLALAGTAFWLETQGKLLPVLTAIDSPSPANIETGTKWIIAIVGLIFVLSILPDEDRAVLLTVIVIAALAANYTSKGSKSVIGYGLTSNNTIAGLSAFGG